ncbi:MAG: TIGR03618 family F420-dependent PPOX class oxidoreductase [Candidatus Binataceae bacterium]
MPMREEEIEKLLAKPNVAVVAVTAPDGAPHAVPTWYEYQGGEIVFHTAKSAFKYRCLAHDPRITLCVDTRKPPYKAVILKGRVRMEERLDDERTERMAIAYLGEKDGRAYANSLKGEKVVVVRFRPTRVISWDYGQEPP